MLAAISLSVRELPCGPPNKSSAVCMCRLVKIAAMIPITRLRPSSIAASYQIRLFFAHGTGRTRIVIMQCFLIGVCEGFRAKLRVAYSQASHRPEAEGCGMGHRSVFSRHVA